MLRIVLMSLGLLLALWHLPKGQVNAAEASIEQLTVAYVYHISRLIQWPESKSMGDFIVCTYPKNRFDRYLYVLEGRMLDDRPIQIREVSLVEELKQCHMVFVDALKENQLKMVINVAQAQNIFTMSMSKGFADKGGMLHFFERDGRLRFLINYKAAKKASLNISTRLLELASRVLS